MTAGPTPLPPAVSLAMAEPMLYHRAPAFVDVYARVLQPPASSAFATAERGSDLRVLRHGGTRVRRRQPRKAAAGPRSWPPAASSESAGPSCRMPTAAKTVHWETEWGQQDRSGRPGPGARREPRGRGRVHHLLGILHRRGQRRPGARRGGPPPWGPDRGGCRVGAGRRADPAGRVEPRRGGGRVAEGADVAARARRSRAPTRPRSSTRPRSPHPALLLRLGTHASRGS